MRAFDSAWRYMRVTVVEQEALVSYLKGAPEVLLERSGLGAEERARWESKIEAAAASGYRVLGLGSAPGEAESDITWLGMVLLWDPPRPEVPDAIATTQRAGIRVLMLTGDHRATASAIADSVGIRGDTVMTGEELDSLTSDELAARVREISVFARVSPEHKLALVEALKADGEIVAMTGDGVNDAPGLKRADVGVAMGQRGSDVSREVAGLVLLDDNFATIAAAVEEGRSIYTNIVKFLRFLFSTNVALVLLIAICVTGAALLDLRDDAQNLLIPLLPVQLLWINIIADGPPALALGLDRNPGVMSQPPNPPSAPLLTRGNIRFILTTGVLKAGIGAALFFSLPTMAYSGSATQTAVFLYESLAQLAFVYPSRRVRGKPDRNRVLNLIVLGSVVLQLLTVATPALRTMLGLVALDQRALAIVGGSLLLTVLGAEIWSRRSTERRSDS